MMARSTTRSNQRPDTLMQDRLCQVDETSCNARPDHTLGSIATEMGCPRHVRFPPVSDRTADIAALPKSAISRCRVSAYHEAGDEKFVGPLCVSIASQILPSSKHQEVAPASAVFRRCEQCFLRDNVVFWAFTLRMSGSGPTTGRGETHVSQDN
jgi:hypothetical protein